MKLFQLNYKSLVPLSAILLILLPSCSTYSEKELEQFDAEIKAYIEENNLKMESLENGLYYSILEEGEGDEYIQFTDKVTFIYKGYFLDGEMFQEVTSDDPLKFRVSQLIAGWQDALSLLKNGGEIKLIIPPQLGYGAKNTGVIPPNSILVYELEVLEVK